jgi:O-antigen/teichoic acid export membrane protein
MSAINFIYEYFTTGQERSIKAKVNIIYSFVIKFLNIIINLMYVPLLINYLGTEEYGIWLVLVSIIGWFSFFDIGIGNGLRNKFAEAKANGDIKLARTYVSTAYATISSIFILIGIVFSFIIPFLDWNLILNTAVIPNNKLIILVLAVFIFFSLQFIFQLISVILLADQRTALASSFNLIANIIIISIILLLKFFFPSSLLLLGVVLSGIPVVIFILASFYLFRKDYYKYRPSRSYINLKYARPLFNLGLKFFVIQIAVIIVHSATNLIITQYYSPYEVTIYNIAFKYFFIIQMFWGIILAPLWSGITDAYTVDDFIWIKNTMKKLRYLASVSSLIIIIMLIASPLVYRLWIGDSLSIPINLSFALAMYSIIYVFFVPYITFLNGTGKIKLSTYMVIFQSIIFLPLVYLFIKVLDFGVPGIVYASIVCEIPLRITQPIQYYKLINKRAKRIWDK